MTNVLKNKDQLRVYMQISDKKNLGLKLFGIIPMKDKEDEQYIKLIPNYKGYCSLREQYFSQEDLSIIKKEGMNGELSYHYHAKFAHIKTRKGEYLHVQKHKEIDQNLVIHFDKKKHFAGIQILRCIIKSNKFEINSLAEIKEGEVLIISSTTANQFLEIIILILPPNSSITNNKHSYSYKLEDNYILSINYRYINNVIEKNGVWGYDFSVKKFYSEFIQHLTLKGTNHISGDSITIKLPLNH